MTPSQFETMRRINDEVNAIPYVATTGPDEPYDEWLDAPESGWSWECRDYAIRKAKLLREAGWPPEALHNILCYDELGEFHSVCGVDDGAEEWILDNRYPSPYPMSAPPYAYRWAWRQIAGSTDFEAMA